MPAAGAAVVCPVNRRTTPVTMVVCLTGPEPIASYELAHAGACACSDVRHVGVADHQQPQPFGPGGDGGVASWHPHGHRVAGALDIRVHRARLVELDNQTPVGDDFQHAHASGNSIGSLDRRAQLLEAASRPREHEKKTLEHLLPECSRARGHVLPGCSRGREHCSR